MKRKKSGGLTKPRLKPLSDSSLVSDLKDLEFAAAYLEDVLSEGGQDAFFAAIRNVAAANGGMGKLSSRVGRGRESLYKSFSKSGNPSFNTLHAVLSELGLRFAVCTSRK